MQLEKILSIGGKPGLFRLVTQTRTGFVAESLLDGKKISVGMTGNVSVLSEIAIYTLEEELPCVLHRVGGKIIQQHIIGGTGQDEGAPQAHLLFGIQGVGAVDAEAIQALASWSEGPNGGTYTLVSTYSREGYLCTTTTRSGIFGLVDQLDFQ